MFRLYYVATMEKILQIALLNKYGMHVRPSTALAQLTNKFTSQITVATPNNEPVDAKNVMLLMTLGATCGTELTFKAVGDDAETAVKEIAALVTGRFGGIE